MTKNIISSFLFMMPILERLLSLFFVVCFAKFLQPINWKFDNIIFRIDNTLNIIDVELGDSIDLVCPQYPVHTDPIRIEYYAVYRVTKEEYDSCHITFTNRTITRLILNCSMPTKTQMFTLSFRKYSPIPGGLEFINGEDYYFTSTSTGTLDGINNLEGGHCNEHAMKVTFKVGSQTKSSNHAPPIFNNRMKSQPKIWQESKSPLSILIPSSHNNNHYINDQGTQPLKNPKFDFKSDVIPPKELHELSNSDNVNRAYPIDPSRYSKLNPILKKVNNEITTFTEKLAKNVIVNLQNFHNFRDFKDPLNSEQNVRKDGRTNGSNSDLQDEPNNKENYYYSYYYNQQRRPPLSNFPNLPNSYNNQPSKDEYNRKTVNDHNYYYNSNNNRKNPTEFEQNYQNVNDRTNENRDNNDYNNKIDRRDSFMSSEPSIYSNGLKNDHQSQRSLAISSFNQKSFISLTASIIVFYTVITHINSLNYILFV
ncbi:probable cyclin-dependent serine/threonine-protein kinase DDB_G0292550 isoform X1 [Gordionus sp. m RMFG-2023]|uniref:probable cyclin-dependent serine/threonine-protein kinase DDB_G0292550 isoform X1 n=1 Tax=Gordionus sp. m RMFG-2023 TaxID=3053472 RepID=UPI0031FC3F7E